MTTSHEPADLAELEAALGIRFADRALLRTAVTHRSYLNEVVDPTVADNERLEFLGDALVDFVAGDYLYRSLPDAREGELTALRAALVSAPALASFAARINLGRYLRLGRGEAASGGRERAAILGDAFEAVVGAVFLDRGLDETERLLMTFFGPELAAVRDSRRLKDAKSRLQELAQGRWQRTPHYETVDESGPDHDKRFVVRVLIGDEPWGTGEGRSKAVAARRAARMALDKVHDGAGGDDRAG
jgi:ribonuclease-3